MQLSDVKYEHDVITLDKMRASADEDEGKKGNLNNEQRMKEKRSYESRHRKRGVANIEEKERR